MCYCIGDLCNDDIQQIICSYDGTNWDNGISDGGSASVTTTVSNSSNSGQTNSGANGVQISQQLYLILGAALPYYVGYQITHNFQ